MCRCCHVSTPSASRVWSGARSTPRRSPAPPATQTASSAWAASPASCPTTACAGSRYPPPRKNILHTVRNTAVVMSGHWAGGRLLHRLQVPRVQRRGAVLRLLKLSVRQLRHGSPGEERNIFTSSKIFFISLFVFTKTRSLAGVASFME